MRTMMIVLVLIGMIGMGCGDSHKEESAGRISKVNAPTIDVILSCFTYSDGGDTTFYVWSETFIWTPQDIADVQDSLQAFAKRSNVHPDNVMMDIMVSDANKLLTYHKRRMRP